MSNYRVSSRAYTKMILHAAKYPHCAVNGILLSNTKDSSKEQKSIEITDVIPLFHQCLHVSPMAEIALLQVEAMASENGLQIVGYYAACELFNDNAIDKAPGIKIAEKIAENVSNACFIIVDNAILTASEQGPALHVWQNSDNRWVASKFTVEQSDETLDAVNSLLQRGAMKELYDFDNHLDNISLDWTNEHLNRNLKQLLAMY